MEATTTRRNAKTKNAWPTREPGLLHRMSVFAIVDVVGTGFMKRIRTDVFAHSCLLASQLYIKVFLVTQKHHLAQDIPAMCADRASVVAVWLLYFAHLGASRSVFMRRRIKRSDVYNFFKVGVTTYIMTDV